MKIFISGASGLVGGQCLKILSDFGHTVIGSHLSYPTPSTVYFDTLNVENQDNFDVTNWAPDIIIHCGALTHVDYCESHIEESFEKTVQSTKNLLDIAEKTQAKIILLSTDYVFNGESGPYTESAITQPLNVYGQHKLEAENLVAAQSKNNLILRITNVYGDDLRHKNFVSRLIEGYKNNSATTLSLPFDQYATPTNAADIARAIHLLISHNKSGIYHIAGTDYMNRVELASNIIKHIPDHAISIQPISTESMNQPALRPLYGGLLAHKFKTEFPEFRFSTLDEYLINHFNK